MTMQDLIKDIEEILDKLQRVNVKIDPSKCTFGMEQGKFLGYVLITRGVKAYPEQVKVKLRSPTPRETSYWTSEAGEAFQKIKRRLGKLQMLAVPKEGKSLMICLRPRGKKPQEELAPTPRAWRLYMGRKSNKKGSDVGMILVDLERKEYPHAIRLNFYASEDDMDYEALLARLVASDGRNMKDIHVFVDWKLLMRFWITYLLKAINPKARALIGLTSIRLELLNQEVSSGVKTRPSMEDQDKLREKSRNVSKKAASGKLSLAWEDRSRRN
ncbi:hypothetical protein Tco_0259839 [Tanacetum coccineum]